MAKILLNLIFVLISYSMCAQIHLNQAVKTQKRIEYVTGDMDSAKVFEWLKSPGIKVIILYDDYLSMNSRPAENTAITNLIGEYGSMVEFKWLNRNMKFELNKVLDEMKAGPQGFTYGIYKDGAQLAVVKYNIFQLRRVLEKALS